MPRRNFYEQVVFEMSDEITAARKAGGQPSGDPFMKEKLSPTQIRKRMAKGGPGDRKRLVKEQGLGRVMPALEKFNG
jgi:hypothetical protein